MVSSSLLLCLPVGWLVLFASPSLAVLPYHPTRIFTTDDGRAAYIYSPGSSAPQTGLRLLNTSDSIDISDPPLSIVSADLPFQESAASSSSAAPAALTPVFNGGDLSVLAGRCEDDAPQTEFWHFTPDTEHTTGRWDKLSLSSTDSPSAASRFLSAGFTFSPTASQQDAAFYVFGGMCPEEMASSAGGGNWTSRASYSDDMIKISPDPSSSDAYPQSTYSSSTLASRGPPVAEAGLTITPLTPTYFNTTSTSISQQQNFALIGGHTGEAFINMSQIALFSLPEESWSFEAIKQPLTDKADLMSRSETSEVEPRSGHTAVLTPDGDKIILFGGWVGDVSTPAQPQLAILEIGQGYGGAGEWTWTVPSVSTSPFQSDQGIYGHGATMLKGGVMLVSGGYSMSSSSSSRHPLRLRQQDGPVANEQMMLFDTNSSTFITTYTNPASLESAGSSQRESGGGALRTPSQKAGLGAGIVLGLGAVAGTAAFYLFYSRRLRQRRTVREKELRELALGADRFYAGDLIGGGVDGRGGFGVDNTRSASWGSRQEKNIFGPSEKGPWVAPLAGMGPRRYGEAGLNGNGEREAERTGLLLDLPSPTRGLRRSVHPKGPSYSCLGIGAPGSSPYGPSAGNGEIHTITEQDEESDGDIGGGGGGPLKRRKSPKSAKEETEAGSRPNSDPFKDPPPPLARSRSEMDRMRREREIQGWVDDWETAGAAMDSGRTCLRQPSSSSASRNDPSAHGSSSNNNTSHSHSHSHSNSRSGSPEKSDRTNSNLSEQSTISSSSIQRSLLGSISRNVSMRSASAGYVLFANAAAAMTGRATLVNHPGPPSSSASSAEANRASGGVLDRKGSSSKRSASLNLNSNASSRQNAGRSGGGGGGGSKSRDRAETFSSARTGLGPSQPWEHEALLPSGPGQSSSTRTENHGQSHDDGYASFETPPDSPVRERNATTATASSSSGGPPKKPLGWMGSVRRALTGTAGPAVGVQRRVEEFESRSASKQRPQMSEVGNADHQYGDAAASPRRAVSASAALWRGKKGARDWNAESPRDAAVGPALDSSSSPTSPTSPTTTTTTTTAAAAAAAALIGSTVRRKPLARGASKRISVKTDPDNNDGSSDNKATDGDTADETEEWDVEAAAERRLVQVMFTVPKEKLRVVNADLDSLSLVSRSDGGDGGDGDGDLDGEVKGQWKGKGKEGE